MKRVVLACALLLAGRVCGVAAPGPVATPTTQQVASEQLLREEKHFFECLAVVYHPSFWISYNGSLYFQTRNNAQLRQLDLMKAARASYTALTDPETRHTLAARALVESGLHPSWLLKILLPYSDANPNLTPTITKPFRVLSRYEVLKKWPGGDAVLKDNDGMYFVMGFGHGFADGSGTNAFLVHEGTKTYTTADGQKATLEAFTSASLSADETAVLVEASAAFQKKAAALGQQLTEATEHRHFADLLARATDSNPYLQFQVATAYFEGKGTPQSESLGREWMQRAARNGSGDAKAYLDKLAAGGK